MFANVRSLRPTRRGYAVAAIAFVAFALGVGTGARSLNAVVVPALVALGAGGVQLARADAPTVDRTVPEAGFAGEERTVDVTVESAVPCEVNERVADTLGGRPRPSVTVGHGGAFSYDIEYESRGTHDLGPAECRCTDSLGLFARTFETDGSARALVYPDVFELHGDDLAGLVRHTLGDERSSFDRLREFAPGDTMRDIHWRASAKRPDDEFVVAEYQSHARTDDVTIVGESALGSADAMASTVASLAAHLHDHGVIVTVRVPAGETVAHPGEGESLLRLLALTDDGWVDREGSDSPDVHVLGEGGRATVSFADRDISFDGMVGDNRSREVLT